jgi:hypothetical protein
MGSLSGLPRHRGCRPAPDRSPSGRGRDQPHTGAVLPGLPAECAVRRARADVQDRHRGGNARGGPTARHGRVTSIRGASDRTSGSFELLTFLPRRLDLFVYIRG